MNAPCSPLMDLFTDHYDEPDVSRQLRQICDRCPFFIRCDREADRAVLAARDKDLFDPGYRAGKTPRQRSADLRRTVAA